MPTSPKHDFPPERRLRAPLLRRHADPGAARPWEGADATGVIVERRIGRIVYRLDHLALIRLADIGGRVHLVEAACRDIGNAASLTLTPAEFERMLAERLIRRTIEIRGSDQQMDFSGHILGEFVVVRVARPVGPGNMRRRSSGNVPKRRP